MPDLLEGSTHEVQALVGAVRTLLEEGDAGVEFTAAAEKLPRRFRDELDMIAARVFVAPLDVGGRTHCRGCHLRFTALLSSRLASRSVFFFCPHCRRPLYALAEDGSLSASASL